MTILKVDLLRLRGLIEWGWRKPLGDRMKMHPNQWGKRMDGTIAFKVEELNHVAWAINVLGKEKYGRGWERIGVDDFVSFENVDVRTLEIPQERPRQGTK